MLEIVINNNVWSLFKKRLKSSGKTDDKIQWKQNEILDWIWLIIATKMKLFVSISEYYKKSVGSSQEFIHIKEWNII